MDTYRFRIPENRPGKIITPGIDHGYGVENEVDLVYKNGKYMVIRFPGAQFWNGRFFPPGYSGSEYLLVEIIDFRDRVQEDFKVLKREQPGRKWYKCKRGMIIECDKLAEELKNECR